MDTSEIRYRVADFLKRHPPFNAIDDRDLVALAAHGRVRFFANDEFLTWQGEPHKTHLLVIQQGTVSLWDEDHGRAELRDVRGPGDWIGAEQFHGAPSCLYTARATTDVVTYGFPAYDIEALLGQYPYAASFVASMGSVESTLAPADAASTPFWTYLQKIAAPSRTCGSHATVAEAARLLIEGGDEALAVTGPAGGVLGVVNRDVLLSWLLGAGDAQRPLAEVRLQPPALAGPETSIADGALAMRAHGAVVMTADGTAEGRVLSVVTPRDLLPALGDQPAAILEAIDRADDLLQLRSLNQRARAFVLERGAGAASSEWMARFCTSVDQAIFTRARGVIGCDARGDYWSWGTSGRGESLTARMPQFLLLQESTADGPRNVAARVRLVDALAECGYLPASEADHEPDFYVATSEEWARRYVGWIRNPVLEGMQRDRALFDVRPLSALRYSTGEVARGAHGAIDRDFLRILAHDCLADLPPLSFYENAVVEHSGEHADVFRLQRNVLQPLVDLGRVFGMATRRVLGTSTVERFAAARRLLPEHEWIFREASEAVRIVLYQQGRVGISQGTTGVELPPSTLSRNDRHLLKSAFPVIQRLLEFAADPSWLDAVRPWDEATDAELIRHL